MIRPAALSPTGNNRMAGSYADLILGCLHREIRRLFHRTVESEGQEHMETLRREIGAAPAEDWSLKKIASKLNMSVSTLLRRIRKLHDATPSDLILHFRLRSAARLLAGTDRPIFLIAEFAGYESTSSFAATFKKHFKCPPSNTRPNAKVTEFFCLLPLALHPIPEPASSQTGTSLFPLDIGGKSNMVIDNSANLRTF